MNYWNWSDASIGWQIGEGGMSYDEARRKLLGNLERTDRNSTIPVVTMNDILLSEKECVDERDGDGSNPVGPVLTPTQRGRAHTSRTRGSSTRGIRPSAPTRFIRGNRGSRRGSRTRGYDAPSTVAVAEEQAELNMSDREGHDKDAPNEAAVVNDPPQDDIHPPGEGSVEPEKEKPAQAQGFTFGSEDIRYKPSGTEEKGIDRTYKALSTRNNPKRKFPERTNSAGSSADEGAKTVSQQKKYVQKAPPKKKSQLSSDYISSQIQKVSEKFCTPPGLAQADLPDDAGLFNLTS